MNKIKEDMEYYKLIYSLFKKEQMKKKVFDLFNYKLPVM